MTTLRESLDAIQAELQSVTTYEQSTQDALDRADALIDAALLRLDESETAWRNTGQTYRLVADKYEVTA